MSQARLADVEGERDAASHDHQTTLHRAQEEAMALRQDLEIASKDNLGLCRELEAAQEALAQARAMEDTFGEQQNEIQRQVIHATQPLCLDPDSTSRRISSTSTPSGCVHKMKQLHRTQKSWLAATPSFNNVRMQCE